MVVECPANVIGQKMSVMKEITVIGIVDKAVPLVQLIGCILENLHENNLLGLLRKLAFMLHICNRCTTLM